MIGIWVGLENSQKFWRVVILAYIWMTGLTSHLRCSVSAPRECSSARANPSCKRGKQYVLSLRSGPRSTHSLIFMRSRKAQVVNCPLLGDLQMFDRLPRHCGTASASRHPESNRRSNVPQEAGQALLHHGSEVEELDQILGCRKLARGGRLHSIAYEHIMTNIAMLKRRLLHRVLL